MGQKLTEVLGAVREWAGRVPFPAEIGRDDGDGLRFIWETKDYLAELMVCRGEYAPYRFVSFLILDLRLEPDQEPVYSYFDRENSSLLEIRSALDGGIELMMKERERHV